MEAEESSAVVSKIVGECPKCQLMLCETDKKISLYHCPRCGEQIEEPDPRNIPKPLPDPPEQPQENFKRTTYNQFSFRWPESKE